MRSGKRDKQIVIEALVVGKDGAGGITRAWTRVREPWAAVNNLSGNEKASTAQGGQVAEARTEFEISYRPGMTTAMRVRYAGAVYNIRHIKDPWERHQFLLLTCDTGTTYTGDGNG